MTLADRLLADMVRITEEQDKAFEKEAEATPELTVDESQFSILEPEDPEGLSLTDLAFIENAVVKEAVDYDGKSKEILKEKKKATDFPDIVEQAHPETAYMAEGPMGTGVVENQNEQHDKILNVVQRMPSGFHYNKFAGFVQGLTSMAEGLEAKGDAEAARKVDALANELTRSANHFLVCTPGTIKEAVVPAPVTGVTVPAPVPGVTVPAPVPVPKAPTPKPTPRAVPAPVPGIPPAKPVPIPPERALVPRKPLVPEVLPPKTRALVHAPKPTGLFGRLYSFLAGKGSKATIILGTIGAATFIYNQLTDQDEQIQSSLGTIVGNAKNPVVAGAAQQLDDTIQGVRQALQEGKPDQALQQLAQGEQQANQLTEAAKAEEPPVQKAVEDLQSALKDMGGKTNAFVNQGLQEQGETAKADRDRVLGIQNFLKRHVDETHPITGVFGPRTRNAIHDFVEEMKDDLGITPKLFTTRNLLEHGTQDKLERLWDIWKRPHLYAKPAE